MKIKNLSKIVTAGALITVVLTGVAAADTANLPANASTTSAAMTRAAERQANQAARAQAAATRQEQWVQKGQARGATAVTNRLDSLNKLLTRIQSMKNLSETQKAAFATEIQNQIAALNTLSSKLQADNSTTTLRADLQTIAPAYRIYALIEPQISLLSAVDRVNTVAGMLNTIQGKIQSRLTSDSALSANSTVQNSLSDMTAKITAAPLVAAAAQTEIAGLQPDNGDKTVLASNQAALKDARSKIQSASQDLQAAHKDAMTIIQLIIAADRGLGNASSTPANQ